MAAAAGVSSGFLSRLERGLETSPPSEATLRRLGRELGLHGDDLLAMAGRIPEELERELLVGGPSVWNAALSLARRMNREGSR